MSLGKWFVLVFLASILLFYFFAGGERFLSLDFYKNLYAASPTKTSIVFFLIYLLGTSCSLPVNAALSITSGIIFGPLLGFGISALASTLGATFALLITRYLLRDIIMERFSARLAVVNKGVEEEGAFYLFSLRLVPVVPFWLLNILLGLSSMPVRTFFLTTLIGMMPITAMLVYTGGQLGQISEFSFSAVFSPTLLAVFCALAVFPFLARFTLSKLRERRLVSSIID